MTLTVPPTTEATTPRWRGINHLALNLPDEDALVELQQRLNSADCDVTHIIDHGAPTRRRLNLARDICARLAVTSECLDLALRTDSEGVWAGMTHSDRLKLAHVVSSERIAPKRYVRPVGAA